MTNREVISQLDKYIKFFNITESEDDLGELYISDVQLRTAAEILQSIKRVEKNTSKAYEMLKTSVATKGKKYVLLDAKEISNATLTLRGPMFIYTDQLLMTNNVLTTKETYVTNK